MKQALFALAVLIAAVTIGVLAGPARAATQPHCSGIIDPATGQHTGYDYAGFAGSTLAIGAYMSADIADFGSGWGGPGEGGHIAGWVGVTDGSGGAGQWMQAGILYGGTGILYAYIESHYGVGGSYFQQWPISSGVYYTAKVTRNSQYVFTASVAGHSQSETFLSPVPTYEQATGENFQVPIGSLCNIANQGFKNLHPTSLDSGIPQVTNAAAFDTVGGGTGNPFSWWSPWTQGSCGQICAPVGP